MYKKMAVAVSVCVMLAVALTGCVPISQAVGGRIVGSGNRSTRTYDFSDFNQVEIQSAFKVTLTPGDRYIVEVTAEDNLLDYVKVTKTGKTLSIRYDTSGFSTFSSKGQTAAITLPELVGVKLSGASEATMGGGFQRVASFEGSLSGASKLNGPVQAGAFNLNGSGASQMALTGSGTSVSVRGDGASKFDLRQLAVDKATVVLSGASQATMNIKSNLDYRLSGASNLTYTGSPAIGQAETSGASQAKKQ